MSRRQPGSSTGPSGPNTSRRVPTADPGNLVDRISDLSLRPPGPGSSPDSFNELLAKLRRFFDNDAKKAKNFLDNFNDEAGVRRREVFLRLFTSKSGEEIAGGQLVDCIDQIDQLATSAALVSKKLPYLDSLKTATEILDADLPAPLTRVNSNASKPSSQSNAKFRDDPIMLQYFSTNQFYERARQAFFDAINKVDTFFYDDPVERWVVLEGDVTDVFMLNILDPVARIMNKYLMAWYIKNDTPVIERRIIRVRAQYRPQGSADAVDHVLILSDYNNWSNHVVLVSYEYKKIKTLREAEWTKCAELCRTSNRPELLDGTMPEMRKMLPQIRKYIFKTGCPYIVLSDSINHYGMLWDKPKGWDTSRWDLTGRYNWKDHVPGQPHRCQLIKGSNTADEAKGCWPPRTVVAFLCFLALMDNGIGP
ncbi:hypothetical protein JB92DRAFT_3148881 [Gautieria morchelliformis]|nr:hypothetical protein JB92DRAFT_3148881 [Gautieria morchelliformis]